MSYFRVLSALSVVLFITQALHAEATGYPTVTDDRLLHPDAGDWLMYRRTYDGSGFSPLKEITPSNIHKLSLAWSFSTDLVEAHETTPIVNHGRMFITTPGNNIIALDAKTGTQLWRYVKKYPDGLFQLHPTNRGVALYGDLVYMATTDCALVALDAASGKGVWTVPYWGTANPAPWVADNRPGDNLYTDSTIALDVDTGKIKSYHQYTPHDSWDWDEVSAPLLIDTEVDGRLVKTATHAGRNGYLWILDRDHDQLKFLHAFPFSNNNVFKSIDSKTGRPVVDETKRPGARGFYVGYEAESIFGSVRTGPGALDHLGELQAWDLNTGRRVWQHNFKTILWAPLLVTGGDIVFAGGTPDRQFRAFDARTGDQLWSFPAPSGVIGIPTSFEVDGEQYIAVTSGWGLDAQGVQNGIDKILGTKTAVPKGGTILVFKLQ